MRVQGAAARRANGRRLFLLALMLLVFLTMVLPWGVERLAAATGESLPLDLTGLLSPEGTYAVVERLGPAGRREAALLMPLLGGLGGGLMALLLRTLLRWLLGQVLPPRHPLQYLAVLPFLALAAAVAAGVGLVAILLAFPQRLEGVAQVTRGLVLVAGSIAGSALVLAGGIAVVALGRALRKRGGDEGQR
jgi:hypothetical protein